MTCIRVCKEARTCPSLASRRYYFEPNPCTAQEWREKERVYLSGIDPRVVFVCESPGKFGSDDQAAPLRCWAKANTWRDKRFREALERYGFANCYITNAVKCGVREGRQHKKCELTRCRRWLVRELKLIQPLVVVGVGENAYRTLCQDVLHLLDSPPEISKITHFYFRGDVWPRWEQEFPQLQRLLEHLKPRSDW